MILGGVVCTQGRRTFLRAGRHRFRLVPDHRHLEPGSDQPITVGLRQPQADDIIEGPRLIVAPNLCSATMASVSRDARQACSMERTPACTCACERYVRATNVPLSFSALHHGPVTRSQNQAVASFIVGEYSAA
ncbi:hypothetical protein G7043_25375 [Lentzea sp. NEAU-D13]|uniref:Uncharacterized protein n=1 Tax=Lentzea alba TaxID=2714351 RepID=A0A7C9VYK9_9PSEU|nr:hypothetical protein [Lentzea alba]NGY62258.1 hypothetical protein [Lentzea alba]